jgi:hypothetical protein
LLNGFTIDDPKTQFYQKCLVKCMLKYSSQCSESQKQQRAWKINSKVLKPIVFKFEHSL